MEQIRNSDFKIPFFVDATEPPDHKCGGCEHRVWAKGKWTCLLVDKDIDLSRVTCLLWEHGPEKYGPGDIRPSRVTPETAGYVEADVVNCGSCMHYEGGVCGVWDGKVRAEQCCDVWERGRLI